MASGFLKSTVKTHPDLNLEEKLCGLDVLEDLLENLCLVGFFPRETVASEMAVRRGLRVAPSLGDE